MNLLIGLAVTDIDVLMKKARRKNIIARIDLIYDMMEIRVTKVYNYCAPKCLKKVFESIEEDVITLSLEGNDTDKRFTKSMKKRLLKHCIRREEAEEEAKLK